MIRSIIDRLEYLTKTMEEKCAGQTEEFWSYKSSPEKWSRKEILGHLTDSVTNNHHRLIRSQFEDKPSISYQQDLWVRHGYFGQMPGASVLAFWLGYNRHFIGLLKVYPDEMLSRECFAGEAESRTIYSVIVWYMEHLEHHLHQIADYV